jgi:hypothetical protein
VIGADRRRVLGVACGELAMPSANDRPASSWTFHAGVHTSRRKAHRGGSSNSLRYGLRGSLDHDVAEIEHERLGVHEQENIAIWRAALVGFDAGEESCSTRGSGLPPRRHRERPVSSQIKRKP